MSRNARWPQDFEEYHTRSVTSPAYRERKASAMLTSCRQNLSRYLKMRGNDHVRQNWTGMFRRVPDIKARVLRSIEDGDTLWSDGR
jgi:hypothetical protein